jgi:hypothetical protein
MGIVRFRRAFNVADPVLFGDRIRDNYRKIQAIKVYAQSEQPPFERCVGEYTA